MSLNVNEIFGPTIQGEGSSTGRRCYFLRLFQCNLACSFCDTPYTWAVTDRKAALHREGIKYSKSEESTVFTLQEVVNRLEELKFSEYPNQLLVISGGEPMLQQDSLIDLVKDPYFSNTDIEIETAGTLPPKEGLRHLSFNVSPKLSLSGNPREKAIKPDVLREFSQYNSVFKFVVSDAPQFEEVRELVEEVGLSPSRVWIMPEGTTEEATRTHSKKIIDEALALGYNFTLRNHILLWGLERGK